MKSVHRFALCLLVPLLSSCETIGRVIDTGGDNFNRVCISRQDQLTDGTAEQILENNKVGERLYGWKKCSAK